MIGSTSPSRSRDLVAGLRLMSQALGGVESEEDALRSLLALARELWPLDQAALDAGALEEASFDGRRALLPLRAAEGPALVLALQRAAGEGWSDEERALALLLAEQGAQALARARLVGQLRKENHRLATLLDEAPAQITVLEGPALAVTLSNRAHQAQTGGRPLLGRPLGEAMPELAGQTALDELVRVYRTGEPFVARAQRIAVRGADGRLEERTYDVSWQPVRGATGRIEGVATFSLDVTEQVQERERAEQLSQALGRRERELQLALDAGRLGTWLLWPETGERQGDTRTAEIYGIDGPTRASAAVLKSLIHPEDWPHVAASLQALQAPGFEGRYNEEYRIFRKNDGALRWLRSSAQRHLDAQGRIFYAGVAQDITTEKELEERLRRSADEFRLLAETMPQIVWTARADGTLDYANQRLTDLVGAPTEAAQGAGWQRLVHPDDLAQTTARWERAVRTGADYETEFRLPYRQGGWRWHLVRARPVRGPDGHIRRWFGTATDVDDQKQAAERLRQSSEALAARQQMLAQVVEQMPHQVLIAEANPRRLLLHNRQVAEQLRLPETRAPEGGALLSTAGFRPDGRPLAETDWPLARALDEGRAIAAEPVHLRRGDGTLAIVEYSAAPIRDGQGRVTHAVAVGVDVTERTEAEEALRFLADASAALAGTLAPDEALSRLCEAAVPRMADACVAVVRDEAGAARLAACVADPAQTKALREAFARERPDAPEDWPRVLRTGQAELVADGADGARIVVPLVVDGRCTGALRCSTRPGRRYTRRDLLVLEETARRASAALETARLFALAQAERTRAEELNRVKDEFVALVSHELRTPMTAVLGWTQILRRSEASEERLGKGLEIIERNARAQARLIGDLLDVSRIITGKLRLELVPTQLADGVQAALDSLRPAAEAKGVQLVARLSDASATVLGDPQRLQQIAWNLLSNAVKFTPPGGTVEASVGTHDGSAQLTVRDTGEGIAQAFLPHLFERFRQADSSTTRRHGGLGLGLSIVRQLAELHGGRVEAESAGAGQGATFRVHLPLYAPEGASASASLGEPQAQELPLAGRSVLVVEDEPDVRELVAMVLGGAGMEVRQAGSAREALRLLDEGLPDLLLCDLAMPDVDGYELLRRVRARTPDRGGALPALALTAYARPEDRARALAAGFQGWQPKPVDPVVLLAAVAALLPSGALPRPAKRP